MGEAPTEAGARPILATNYGLLVEDAPGSPDWNWVCEEVVGAQGFAAQAEIAGRWFLASFDGVQVSDDLCDWPFSGPPLDGRYVTSVQGDPVEPERVWVTTASGSADNALFRSDDRGDSFVEHASFGAGSALRGFAQGDDGLPLYVIGWVDVTPTVWISADGKSWEDHVLVLDGVEIYSVSLLGHAHGSAWARVVGATEDHLVQLDPDGSLTLRRVQEEPFSAFAPGEAPGELYVGSREGGLLWSTDMGATWSEPVLSPEPGCLEDRGELRYICGHNWADGATVLSTTSRTGDPATWSWEPVAWFGDVRGLHECPADSDTTTACTSIWENASPEAGFDQERAEDSGIPDEGSADTGAPPADPDGCGCAAGAGGGGLLVLLGGLAGVLRRRR